MRETAAVHNNAVSLVLLELSNLGVYAQRREVGMFYNPREVRMLREALITGRAAPSLHPHRIGVEGEADIQGVIPPHGRALAVEIKVGQDRLRPKQAAWRKMWANHGGVHLVVHPDKPEWKHHLAEVIMACKRR